jgi:hypothetical protein
VNDHASEGDSMEAAAVVGKHGVPGWNLAASMA